MKVLHTTNNEACCGFTEGGMKEHVVSLSSPLDDCYSYRAESLLDKHSSCIFMLASA